MRAPTGLLTDLQRCPLTVDAVPRLSWQIGGGAQSGWHIQLATAEQAGRGDLAGIWDSGVMPSATSTNVPYRGPTLAPATKHAWRVRTFDERGEAGPWSAPATFGTGLAEWSATPIWAAEGDWAFLRGVVGLAPGEIASAVVYATARSSAPARQYVFRLYVNGEVVGVGPAWSDAAETFYNAYDVTELMRPGRDNVVAALAHTTAERAFLAQLVVVRPDGRRDVFGSGPDWRALSGEHAYPASGSIGTSYYTAPQEALDATAWPEGFAQADFDDRAWPAAVSRPAIAGARGLQTETLLERPEPAARVTMTGPGRCLVDFGRTWAGGLRVDLVGVAGDQLDICLGEELTPAGEVLAPMRTGNDYRERWTLRDGGQTLRHWGYRVFRYAQISGLRQPLAAEDVSAMALVYPFDREASAFSSSDDALNRVWQFCRDSIEALNLDLYLDSATRERQPYEADAYLQMLAHLSLDGGWALARHSTEWLLPVERATWPTEWKLYSVLAVREYWMQTGDTQWLAQVYPLLTAKLPTRYVNADGLIEKPEKTDDFGADIVDWPPDDRDGYVFTEVNTVVNAFAFRAFADMAAMAGALGRADDARRLDAVAARLRAAINTILFDPSTGAYRDGRGVDHHSAHASIYAVALGVATDRERPAAVEHLASRGMACSIFGAPFLIDALYRGGRPDDGLRLLTSRGPRSWLHMIDQGAGASMEAWSAAVKPNTSYSHPAGASPAFLVPRAVFGIRPISPGYSTFAIAPQPGGLPQAEIVVPTVKGPIGVSFTSEGGRLELSCEVPANTRAAVGLARSSSAMVEIDGERRVEGPDGSDIVLGPGRHTVRSM